MKSLSSARRPCRAQLADFEYSLPAPRPVATNFDESLSIICDYFRESLYVRVDMLRDDLGKAIA
jgi:hypothetical protein